jgi:hypothetical protein
VHALYWALGRGWLITEQVLDVSALIYILLTSSYMRILSLRAGPIEQRGTSLPLPCSNRGPPLLPFPLPFHQDPLGADFELVDFRTFHEASIGEIRDNQHSERGG